MSEPWSRVVDWCLQTSRDTIRQENNVQPTVFNTIHTGVAVAWCTDLPGEVDRRGEGVWPPNFHAVFTARKRSLGQGNLFTPVCDSVHRGVSWQTPPSGADTPPRQTPPQQADTPSPEMATAADGTHPAGMHSCTCLEENLVDTTAFHSDAYYPLENRTYFSFSCHH